MTWSGSEALRKVQAQIRRIGNERQDLDREISVTQSRIRALENDREALYTRLARIYLPDLSAESVAQTLQSHHTVVSSIYQQKKERREELLNLMDSNKGEREQVNTQFETITKNLATAEEIVDSTKEFISRELQEDEHYQGLRQRAEAAFEKLNQYRKQHDAFCLQAQKHLPKYETNPFFAYLKNREFNTKFSRGSWLTKRLDSVLAHAIKYHQQKEKYDKLQFIPKAMERMVQKQEGILEDLIRQGSVFERSVESENDLPRFEEQVQELTQTRSEYMRSLRELDEESKTYEKELSDLENNAGRYHSKALGRITTYLKSERISELRTRALQTPDPTDDHLVESIQSTDTALEQLYQNETSLKTVRATIADQLLGLKKIESHFRYQDYDSRRSVFDNDISPFLTGYLAGKHSSREVIRRIDNCQRFKPRRTHSYSSSSYSSSSSSWSSGGGSSSFGGFSSGGGFGGGGGFSSGGGF